MNALADSLYFLGRFLRQPRRVASVWPSSRFLTAQMFAGLQLSAGDAIVEFGPGTGAFTRVLAPMVEATNVAYLGIERDPGMHRLLTKRFPQLDVQLGDVRDVARFVAKRNLPPVKAVVSGLPMTVMPREVIDEIFLALGQFMHPDGVFRTFTYVHNYPTGRTGELRARMDAAFDVVSLSRPILRNVPPAMVLSGTGPTAVL